MPPSKNNELIGLIPLAGKGERMRPITTVLPKALIEIAGKTLLESSIGILAANGIKKAVVVVGYMQEKIKSFLNAEDFGIQVEFVRQEEQLGLADAILISRKHLTSDFVMLCPDSLYTDHDDFRQAMDVFYKYRPVALQSTAIASIAQKGRLAYPSGSFRNIAPNLFVNIRGSTDTSGLAMYSTGLAFFSKSSWDYLQSARGMKLDSGFPKFMWGLKDKADFMLYLIRGTRYDFTQPEDIDGYLGLQESFTHTVGAGVSVILLNKEGEILLQLRDNIPTIHYPDHWALFGGSIKKDETAYQCIEREVKEEINYSLQNYGLFREFVHNDKREYAFVGGIEAKINELILSEGREMRFFSPSELKNLKIRPDDKDTLKAYFRSNLL